MRIYINACCQHNLLIKKTLFLEKKKLAYPIYIRIEIDYNYKTRRIYEHISPSQIAKKNEYPNIINAGLWFCKIGTKFFLKRCEIEMGS